VRPSSATGLFEGYGIRMDTTSKIRLMAWQIDVIEFERSKNDTTDDDRPYGHVAKWEGGGPQNRYERVRFSPWPHVLRAIDALQASIEKSQVRCTQRRLWRYELLAVLGVFAVAACATNGPPSGSPYVKHDAQDNRTIDILVDKHQHIRTGIANL
jgi:hypothetical protein